MGKLQKKGKAGAAVNYITRNQALKKLQVTLADFRRLCILKGIYPREPKNKKKANKGSTAPATFYYAKDIQYLMHEPILSKFREYKTFAKKMAKVMSKGQYSTAKTLAENKPIYTLDHIIKERYPTFTDALRDLDDALCMVFLFATMPKTEKIKAETIENCQRLAAEFQHYVLHTRSLRKVFLSIKGIYYQAEIKGQTINWLVPYQFSQDVPTDVDFRVMLTFLEFYQTLCGFVNFKLYSDVNLVYPPALDLKLDEGGAGMNALIIESTQSAANIAKTLNEEKQRLEESEKRLKTLSNKIAHIQESNSYETTNGNSSSSKNNNDNDNDNDNEDTMDEFPAPLPNLDGSSSDTVTFSDIQKASQHLTQFQSLFSQCYIFLSREVPRYSLEFILRACGGHVGWDPVLGEGSPFKENDDRITHQISDRPTQGHRFLNRHYVQPQWAYDSINAGKILAADPYHVGKTLPPHLSPFVEAKEGDYIPDQNQFEGQTEDLEIESAEEDEEEEDEEEEDEDEDEDEDEEGEEEEEEEDTEDLHQRELEAEAKGVAFTEFEAKENKKNAKKTKAVTAAADVAPVTRSAGKKRTAAEAEEAEAKELAKIMMTNKQQKLYNKIQYGKNKKAAEVEKLTKKKEQLAKEAKAANKKARK
ncbi:mRNA-binding ribosome synthesis protein nop7 [Lobosporangium transversale]|uniref:Pescadillo homolog n=1 Tax=Lobosporangium transversale TaxID=64571 RepID=A0A1Y2GBZ2_9FUNG|nr:Pescadillo N-terminus-domain-containing protein [Lobosporangium transversale]KAF9910164.1 mRNA-binding ribosome synthesis protein nop7 [Lobosporangium transversale]ORZ06605.1 Pescadillo N-terminus-domain-containing protein [Lobosporangium transversale]|eukprot:XP_021877648.1 Pescadillo N-terminus-domain-containing protein [Lobosporangium transversale]